ncbi:class I adenylate-forming enzyme family protein [Trueperella bialowiezensis]|uniref:Short-chain-fatty-acid--CoA ligase n=1 Tax=Trueperella bialowiezensis TaxID=312285 RepID=A0A448PDG3_9ACTO|nr:AMP-binding protein [Trueperella bialowiezensis]VEI12957.1 Short-chain-fatty-acid--CoA ligase [Trueperella bialowiezensis]
MHSKPTFNSAHSLDRAAKAHPDRTSLVYGSQTMTVLEAAERTRQLAQLLGATGVSAGDRVMLIARNSPYHMLFHVACARIGAVFVPVSHRLTRADHLALVDFCAPRVLVADVEVAEDGVFESLGTITHFVIDDDDHAPSVSAAISQGYFGLSAAAQAHNGKFITTEKSGSTALNSRSYPEGPAALLFTSASAGKPKGVELTHEQLWWGARNFREGFEYSNHDTVLTVAPLTHIGGFNGTTLDLFSHGGTVVIVREFNPTRVLAALAEHKVAIMFGVPTMYAALLNDPEFSSYDLSNFRLPLIGGAPVPPPLLSRMREAGLEPLNVWGMTETAASGAYLPAEHLDERAGSIGRPFAHVEARIVNEAGEDATAGELLVRGPNVANSYWHDPDSSAAAFRGGWLHTGDLVRQDEGGFLWITGRKHNVINSGGENIQAEEVQAVLAQFPGVSDCAVIGTPHEVWGEAVSAAIVMQAGFAAPSLAEIQAFASQVLARFKLPRRVVVVDGLPTNANGKADRVALAELFAAAEQE